MQKSLKFFVMAVIAVIAACTVSSCDSDDVDELTSTIWDKTWVSDKGEIYDFYKSFNGVIFADRDDYKEHKIEKSFIWTISGSNMTFAINGYANAEGKWEEIAPEDMELKTYDVTSDNNKLTLKSAGDTMILTLMAE